jgi:hypothetical protein
VLPFQIVGHATPASKTRQIDDPSVLFLELEGSGLDDINEASGALDPSETDPTFTTAVSDANGIFNCLIKVGEPIKKVLRASCKRSSTTVAEADDSFIVSLGDADGITANGDKIILTVDSDSALTSGTHNLCLEVEYQVSE